MRSRAQNLLHTCPSRIPAQFGWPPPAFQLLRGKQQLRARQIVLQLRQLSRANHPNSVLRAEAEETDGGVGEAKGNLPTKCQSAGGGGDRADQPDPSRLGELLCRGRLARMLFVCQRLGREEGSGTSDAPRERSGLGWKRWSREWLYGDLGLYNDYRLCRPWSLPKVQPAASVTYSNP
jgi:hypothetical protein